MCIIQKRIEDFSEGSLDLNGFAITDDELPDIVEALGSLNGLTRLYLSFNQLTVLPDTIKIFFDQANQNLTEATNLTELLNTIKQVLDPSQGVSETDLNALADHLKTMEENEREGFLRNFDDSIVAALIHEAELEPKEQNYLVDLANANSTQLGSLVQSALPKNRTQTP